MAEAIRMQRLHKINDASAEYVSYEPLGEQWVTRFLERHPQLQTVVGHTIEGSQTSKVDGVVRGYPHMTLRKFFAKSILRHRLNQQHLHKYHYLHLLRFIRLRALHLMLYYYGHQT